MTAPLAGKPTFGAGRIILSANVTNPTPIRAATPQSQSVDFKRKTESLVGENMLPEAVAAGEMEIAGKVEYAKAVARIMADLMFGDGSSTGSYNLANQEAGTVGATTPYHYSPVNVATFIADGGVKNATTGAIYACVAPGSEVAGKSYSVSAGIYQFAATDASANILVSYVYSISTAGETISLLNQMQGPGTSFQAVHTFLWGAEQDMIILNSCVASANSIAAKKSGFGTNSLDYVAGVNSSGVLGTATFAEAA